MDGGFSQAFHGEAVETAEILGSAKDTLDAGTLGVDRIGGLRHLMTRVGFNDWDSMVTLHDCTIGCGTITSVGQDVGWWGWQQLKGWPNLVHVRHVGRGHVGTKGDFVVSVRNHVELKSVPPLHPTVRTFLAAGLGVRIGALVARPCLNVAGVDGDGGTQVGKHFGQGCGDGLHHPLEQVSVFQLGDEAGDGVLGGCAANNPAQLGVVSDVAECGGYGGRIEDERGHIGPKEDLRAIPRTARGSLKVEHHVVRQRGDYRFEPFDGAKIGLLAHLGWLRWDVLSCLQSSGERPFSITTVVIIYLLLWKVNTLVGTIEILVVK